MKLFEKNVGTTERLVRAILGVVFLAAAATYFKDIWVYVAALIGIIMLVTAAVGSCFLYTLLGINTGKSEAKKSEKKAKKKKKK